VLTVVPLLIETSPVVGGADVTVVVAVALLFAAFGSIVALVTFAVLLIVPDAEAFTATCRVNVAAAPLMNVRMLQLTVPVAPTAGEVHVNAGPLVCDSDTNVVFVGMTSLSATFCASADPLFMTVIVYVMAAPGAIVAGPLFVTDRSA